MKALRQVSPAVPDGVAVGVEFEPEEFEGVRLGFDQRLESVELGLKLSATLGIDNDLRSV